SFVEFTVEEDAIRFGLLAVKNVGEGAIESIIAARQTGDEFRTLADFCARVDLRLANMRVLESLIKVGAMNRFGHAAQLLEALDDAINAGQAAQRDRLSGQTALFDLGSSPEALERPLPAVPEALSKERLRWEKELLGLYLSEHPLGEIADRLAQYATAYSSDLKDESLDGQRVVIGGIVTGLRTVVTRNKETMAVATLEDLQGTLEVVVFPRMYATAGGTFTEGAILIVAGRVDHRGEEASLLADAVWVWEDAAARGPEAIAQEVAAGDRRGGTGRRFGNGSGNGSPRPPAPATVPATTAAAPGAAGVSPAARPAPPVRVSPLRGGGATPLQPAPSPVAPAPAALTAASGPEHMPAEPLSSVPAPADLESLAPDREEPPLPDDERAVAARASAAPTVPVEAPDSGILNVRFTRGADTGRIVVALEELRAMLRTRPGATRVVFHLPQPDGATLPMELRGGVAYDAELLAEAGRRLGEGLVRLDLTAGAERA
ncbi:MAG: helix-hairpin-helix domain-containing protein, partial [Candidatus Limnocylindrales bacterium]